MFKSTTPRNRPHPLSLAPLHERAFVGASTSTSSKDTTSPITPKDADEHFIDHLWKQVRSKVNGPSEIPAPTNGKRGPEDDEGHGASPMPAGQAFRRTTRRRSITFRDSSDGRNVVVTLDMSGVTKSDIHIGYQHRRLVVSYKTFKEIERREVDKFVQETRERRYIRSIPLSEDARPAGIRAAMDGDQLLISYPKSQQQ
ncbi:hypothetical protein M0805_004408 [Coniferiporia weirii]|nr:hypothetical protein M0805_004408 [Coniferiporia weirii]